MTIQHLLRSVDIEKVLPIIEKWYYSSMALSAEEGYRKAYDELCTMSPAKVYSGFSNLKELEAEAIHEEFIIKAPDGDFNEPWCNTLEFRFWELLVDKEIKCAEGLVLSNEEMAAVCLWHLAYCGFDSKTVRNKSYIDTRHMLSNDISVTPDVLKDSLDDYLDMVDKGTKVLVDYNDTKFAIIKVD